MKRSNKTYVQLQKKKTRTRIRSNIYIYEKQVQVRKQTGAIYSSVPTKEFEALIGSAIKTGGACCCLRCLFFSFVLGIKS